jgi:hypothetical protein
MNPETTLYEEPSSLLVADWETFVDEMKGEAERYPDSENVRETLRFAERMLGALRRDPIEDPSRRAA